MDKKKKGFIFILVIFFMFIPVVLAQNTTEDKAYACLKNKVEDKCSSLTLQDQAFSLMALAYDSRVQSECGDALSDLMDEEGCWPSGSCKLKETAFAILALDRIRENTDKAEKWLFDQNSTPENLDWYLEIDTTEDSSCKISYSGKDYTIKVGSDKKLSSGAGKCLALYLGSYWLEISDSCLDENFEISCDKDFKTTLLYEKGKSGTIYVSSLTNSESAGGKTEEKVDAVCFSQGGKCDYEGSLWAAFALSKKGHNIDAFLPYLTAFLSENKKFFPETILYILTSRDEYLSDIISLQKPADYWHTENSPNTKFYDTALALLALKDTHGTEVESAIDYLEDIQSSDGCFGSIVDTAFLLYAVWPKSPSIKKTELQHCGDYDYYCMSIGDCDEAGGENLENYICSSSDICCSKPKKQETCSEKKGIICSGDKECSGDIVWASDGACCLDSCVDKVETKTECEKASETYYCRDSCFSSDELVEEYECSIGEICCGPKSEPVPGGGLPWFVWFLIILIILLAVAIIFRKKLQMFLFKFKKGKGGGETAQRPPPRFPPSGRMMPRRVIPRQMMARRPMLRQTAADKELEETFKKLKKIGE